MKRKSSFLLKWSCGGLFWFSSCTNTSSTTENYRAIYDRDTAYLELNRSEKNFHGKYKIIHPGNTMDSGDVRGKIIKDTLTGDFYYRPYGWAQKQRKPFALLQENDKLILGTGMYLEYMGIPYYKPGTHNFEERNFIFEKTYP